MNRSRIENLVQIIFPLFGLTILNLLRNAAQANAQTLANIEINVPIPFFYNIPMKPLSNFEVAVFNVSDCNEWYLYRYGGEATEEDREYFGRNEGVPMWDP